MSGETLRILFIQIFVILLGNFFIIIGILLEPSVKAKIKEISFNSDNIHGEQNDKIINF